VAFENCEGKLECVHDACAIRGRDVDILTAVVMHSWAQGISMLYVRCPSSSSFWVLVCNEFTSWRCKRCLVVVHEAIKVSRSGQLWVQSGGPQEIQVDFRLGQKSVPQM
jgi:hypothetical protein